MFDVDKKRRDLIRDIESCADWRERKAQEQPDDERHARSGQALRRAALEMAALPASDPRLMQLAYFLASQPDDEVVQLYLAEESLIIGRYGFGAADASVDELMTLLVTASEKAARQSF